MRVVQALHWLRDLLGREGESDQIRRKLARIFDDPITGPPLKEDLLAGMTTLPNWMRVFLKPSSTTLRVRTARSTLMIGLKSTLRTKGASHDKRFDWVSEDMNLAFDEVLAAGESAMLSAFDTTAQRLGTAAQNIEKDFWVCWTLDVLFNGLQKGGPRLLFKVEPRCPEGFGLINRFSEDINVTVFRDDIGEAATIEELEELSGKNRKARLEAREDACKAYINGPLRDEPTVILADRLKAAGVDAAKARIEPDDSTPTVKHCWSGIPRRRRVLTM